MDFEALVKNFCAAVEAGDGGRLAELFSEDGSYHDTFYGEFQGREAIREMLEARFYGDAERFLWRRHRKRQVHGYRFRRQFPLGGYYRGFRVPGEKALDRVGRRRACASMGE